jgi:hypothetical protein
MEKFKSLGMVDGEGFFNPQVDDWKPELAVVEAGHLAEDCVVCVPITKETYSLGSLAETGFSLMQAMKLDDRRDFVVLIEQELDEELMVDAALSKESLRSRALVLQHLKKLRLANVYVVDTLEEMLDVALKCYEAHKLLDDARKQFNPHLREE